MVGHWLPSGDSCGYFDVVGELVSNYGPTATKTKWCNLVQNGVIHSVLWFYLLKLAKQKNSVVMKLVPQQKYFKRFGCVRAGNALVRELRRVGA